MSDDAPTLAQTHFDRAEFRVSGTAATRAKWQDAMCALVGKQRVNILPDTLIIENPKATAGKR